MIGKAKLLFILMGSAWFTHAQSALYNVGNMQIHQNGQLGLHTNLINDGVLDDNLGLAGLYGTETISVSGAFPATFFNLEIANAENVIFNTALNSSNNAIFILGNIITPRTDTGIHLNFFENALSTSSNDLSKVDGYVQINQKQSFTFPVGDEDQLRPLILTSGGVNEVAKCAYFFESPNSPSSFPTSFNTGQTSAAIEFVSRTEFWRLEGDLPSTVQLSWNARSNISQLTDDPAKLIIAGWNKATNQWESLSDGGGTGDMIQGFANTVNFVPNEYEIITFASTAEERPSLITVDNFLVTPNGDGINDSLVIPELELSSNNKVLVFNRFGLKVFEIDNYTDEFEGIANTGNVLYDKSKGLPAGVYFFLVKMYDLNLEFQAFLYLDRN